MRAHDEILRDTIARHFPDAQVKDDGIALGFGDVELSCWVDSTRDLTGFQAAALYFTLRGGKLGSAPIFASISGYGATSEAAILEGGCNWACSFGPVLRAALADEPTDAKTFETTCDGQRMRVHVESLDRGVALDEGIDLTARAVAARARFAPDGWLVRTVLESGGLPLLHASRPTVLSVFISDAGFDRTVEVKVDGCDWPHMSAAFANVPGEAEGAIVMLRELAIVVPIEPAPPLARAAIERTLDGIADLTQRRDAAHWPGWAHHEGVLSVPLSEAALARVEQTLGELPADYRAFLATIGASGAGPGYGLLPPIGELHEELAKQPFALVDESNARTAPSGTLPLAHAGCGVMWLLVLRGPHRGEVWVDARSADRRVRKVAPSFSAWYREWLATAVRNSTSFLQWDPSYCATAAGLSQFIEGLEEQGVPRDMIGTELARRIKPGAIALSVHDNFYFPDEHPVNPCEGCVRLVERFGMRANVFAPGDEDLDEGG